MTHTYSITNMNCTGCVGHIKEQIEKHPDVTLVDVSLEQNQAVINMNQPITIQELQLFLDKDTEYAGRYSISE
ncbi:MAG: heavy-metal-associated domain-containing protein [Flavobacteriales bacterium]|nr:heavy-metal-associated domain-containing protein [Flavobacteriales bacterium]